MRHYKSYFLFFLLFLLLPCYHAEAAFFVKGIASAANTPSYCKTSSGKPVQLHSGVFHLRDFFSRHFSHNNNRAEPKKGNSRGIASLLCMGLFLAFFTAVVIITPTIPDPLTFALIVSGFASSITAIALGVRGVKYDSKKGFALAGLTMGVGVLLIEILLQFMLLMFLGRFYLYL